MLAARLDRPPFASPHVTYPVLVWHRTVQRPIMLMFHWKECPVYVTYSNAAGVIVSTFMWYTLATRPLMRLTLLYWKFLLRRHTTWLGSNTGQVSTYALFAMLLQCASDLDHIKEGSTCYENLARTCVTAHLVRLPRAVRTPDPLDEDINLTSQSYQAPLVAQALRNLPACVVLKKKQCTF